MLAVAWNASAYNEVEATQIPPLLKLHMSLNIVYTICMLH